MCSRKRILPAQVDHHADCLEFGLIRTRGEISRVACANRRRARLRGRRVDGAGKLCMHQQRQAGFRDSRKRTLQLLAVDHGEAIAAGVDQEAFEAGNPGAGQWQQVGLVVRDRAAPGRPVDQALAGCGLAFGLQRGDRRGLRQAVQRHVDQRGVAARGCRPRGGSKALPLGAAGLVDVDMAVDQAGQQRVLAEVDCVGVGGQIADVAHRANDARPGPSSSSSAARRVPCGVTTRSAMNACAIIAIIRHRKHRYKG